LESIFAKAKVCLTATPNANEPCLSLEPDLTEIMEKSRDYNELLQAWKGWHDATGPKMRHIFAQTVELQNKAAVQNDYTDLSEEWIDDFEDENFEQNAQDLFERIKPLYDQVHTYVRNKLEVVYGSNYPLDHDAKLIPAHLLGNMWAQQWDSIFDLIKPFQDAIEPNLTQSLIQKKYTPLKMFKEAESFFRSLNLYNMTPAFWRNSVITKPKDRDMVCHASASDFFNQFDYRIKMCTVLTDDNFVTIHHEMGHVEYYMAYSQQPAVFRTGANSAFLEAIGDTIALSVLTPKHFKEIGIIEDDTLSYGS
jgi:peptidyl-dipeptidase A